MNQNYRQKKRKRKKEGFGSQRHVRLNELKNK